MSEDVLIPIVDKDDQIITHKKRADVQPNDIYRITALWVIDDKNNVLIEQRSWKKKKDPGRFSAAVVGTVEKNETYEFNVVKEAEEEIGLSNVPLHFIKKYLYQGNSSFFCSIFYVVVNQPLSYFKYQKEEIEQLLWISYPDLIQDLKDHPDKYVPSLPDFLKHIQHLHEGKK